MINRIDRYEEVGGEIKRDLVVREAPLGAGVYTGLEFALYEVNARDSEVRFARFEWETLPLGSYAPDGSGFHLPGDSAQRLMDALWAHGLRPSKSEPASETKAAMEAHISDLRAFARHALGMDGDG